jgi:hypothetical protein
MRPIRHLTVVGDKLDINISNAFIYAFNAAYRSVQQSRAAAGSSGDVADAGAAASAAAAAGAGAGAGAGITSELDALRVVTESEGSPSALAASLSPSLLDSLSGSRALYETVALGMSVPTGMSSAVRYAPYVFRNLTGMKVWFTPSEGTTASSRAAGSAARYAADIGEGASPSSAVRGVVTTRGWRPHPSVFVAVLLFALHFHDAPLTLTCRRAILLRRSVPTAAGVVDRVSVGAATDHQR